MSIQERLAFQSIQKEEVLKTLVFDTETHLFEPWDKVRTVWSPPDLVCLSYVLFDDKAAGGDRRTPE
jgi:hypothetical protein